MRKIDLIEIKQVQLNILKTVADFCEKNKIKYFLAYGSLLGAVRHNGYIPWDDDIDIMMLRTDYLDFINTFNETNTEKTVVSHYIDSKFPYTFAKIYDVNTHLNESSGLTYPLGINIDLFPIDNLPSDYNLAKKHTSKILRLIFILNLKKIKLSKKRNFLKNLVLFFGKVLFAGINYKYIISRIDYLALKYNHCDSKYVANLVLGVYGLREISEKKIFGKTIKLEFEEISLNAPAKYNLWLKNIYGDYMQLPPVDKRFTHHVFDAYVK